MAYVISKLNRKAAPTEVRVFCSQALAIALMRLPALRGQILPIILPPGENAHKHVGEWNLSWSLHKSATNARAAQSAAAHGTAGGAAGDTRSGSTSSTRSPNERSSTSPRANGRMSRTARSTPPQASPHGEEWRPSHEVSPAGTTPGP